MAVDSRSPRAMENDPVALLAAVNPTASTSVDLIITARGGCLRYVAAMAHWLMDNPVDLGAVAVNLRNRPNAHRVVQHPTGIVLIFDRARSQITLLRPSEWQAVHTLSTDTVGASL